MTTVTVVRKDGRIAIAADTLTKWGEGCGRVSRRIGIAGSIVCDG
jgi:ATP-dependent protease HslVU (ClpYQ) peptidase subunit